VEVEELRVQVYGGEGARGDDHGGEALEDGLDGEGGIEARQLQHRVGDLGQLRIERLYKHHEALYQTWGGVDQG
jgi:hypothetical protein